MHVIAAKATAFKLAAEPEFKDRQERTIRGAQILAERLTADDSRAAGIDVLTGGTDVHLVLVDLRNSELDGQQAEDLLHEVGITVNRNAVPFDPRPPMVTSGVRIGTPALATRGFGDAEFTEVADIIALALQAGAGRRGAPRPRRRRSPTTFPLYPGLTSSRAAGHDRSASSTGSPPRPRSRRAARSRIAALRERGRRARARHAARRRRPRLASYVGGKHRDCAEVGIESIRVDLPATASRQEVAAAIADLNADPAVTGYIVQLPLPRASTRTRCSSSSTPTRTPTACTRPTSAGSCSASTGELHSPLPCTPAGIIELLRRTTCRSRGKHVVVIGRGLTVGRPLGPAASPARASTRPSR